MIIEDNENQQEELRTSIYCRVRDKPFVLVLTVLIIQYCFSIQPLGVRLQTTRQIPSRDPLTVLVQSRHYIDITWSVMA